MADKQKGYTHVTFYCKTKSRSKVTEALAESALGGGGGGGGGGEIPPPLPPPPISQALHKA